MAAGTAPTAWRSAAVAICLLPVVLPLAVLCLPLLCCAVAVVRFRRRRRRRMAAARKESAGCCFGGDEERLSSEREEDTEGDGHRAALLQQYLEDQMELVGSGAEAEEGDAMAAEQAKKASAPIGHEYQELS